MTCPTIRPRVFRGTGGITTTTTASRHRPRTRSSTPLPTAQSGTCHPELTAALNGAVERPGEALGVVTQVERIDISPFAACTIAHWGARTRPTRQWVSGLSGRLSRSCVRRNSTTTQRRQRQRWRRSGASSRTSFHCESKGLMIDDNTDRDIPSLPRRLTGRQIGTSRLDYVLSVALLLGQCLLLHAEDGDLHQPAREPPKMQPSLPVGVAKSERTEARWIPERESGEIGVLRDHRYNLAP